MRPDQDFDDEIRGHMGPQRERTDRARRIRRRHVWPRSKEFGNVTLTRESISLASSLGRRRWRVGAGHPHRMAFSPARQGSGDGRCVDARAGHRGERCNLQRRSRSAASAPRQSRRDRLIYIRQRAPGLGAENTAFSVPGNRRLQVARFFGQRLRRLLHDRVPPRRLRRAPRGRAGVVADRTSR